MKKIETKALKPSEMGLHSKVHCEIILKGKTRVEQTYFEILNLR